jgi:predicted PurR-regulated permease PerM
VLDRLSKKKRNIGLLVVLALIGWFFWTIRSVLNPLILGYLLAFVLHPAVLHLERKRGWSRPRAVNVIFLAAALFMTVTLGGIYLQGKQIVESVAAANSKDDVLLRAEHRIDAFLAKARAWSDRLTGGSKKDEPEAEEPASDEEGGTGAGTTGQDDAGSDALGAVESAPGERITDERITDERITGEPATGEQPTLAPVTGEPEPSVPPAEVQAEVEALGAPGAPPANLQRGSLDVDAAEPQPQRGPDAAQRPAEDPTLRDLVQAWWKGYIARNEGSAGAVALQNVPAVIVVLVNFFGSIASLVALLLLLPIYGYFLLFELERIHRFVRRHIPKGERERVTRIGTQIGGVIANFFRGRLLICVLKGTVITLGLTLGGAPYALFFGVMAGLMSLVPFVGPTLTFVCAMLFGLQDLSFVSALLWIGGTFLLGEILEGYVFIPKILGDSLGLHPVVVLVSIFAGGAALGMFGFLIAIPLTAALVILARELLLPALRQFADEDSHTDTPLRQAQGGALVAGALPGGVDGAGAGGASARPDPGTGNGAGDGPAGGPGAETPGPAAARRRRK